MTIDELIEKVRRRFGGALPEIWDVHTESMINSALEKFAEALWDDQSTDAFHLIKDFTLTITAGHASFNSKMIARSVPELNQVRHSSSVFELERLDSLLDLQFARNNAVNYYVFNNSGVDPFAYGGTPLTGTVTVRSAFIPLLSEVPVAREEAFVDVLTALVTEAVGRASSG